MPSSISIDLSQWNDLHKQLQKLLVDDQQAIVNTVATNTVVLFDKIARDVLPPPISRKRASPYWTEKQRRWWWATLRAKALGKSRALPGWNAKYVERGGRMVLVISGAYKRTGTLVKSLGYRVTSGQSGNKAYAKADYGTNRTYAPYVIGMAKQSAYHRDNWQTLEALLSASSNRLEQRAMSSLWDEIRKRVK
jgi:hypothetical protein